MSVHQNLSNSKNLALRSDLHIVRKLWHIGMGSFLLYIYVSKNIEARVMSYILMALSLTSFLVDFTRIRVPLFNKIVLRLMGPFMRESEKNSYSGLPYYALGASLSLFLFEERIALLGICFLILADPISSFFGILYGKDKILKNKSLQGSFAGFVTCFLISLSFGLYYGQASLSLLAFSLLGGLIGSLSELCSIYIDDNLTIPVISGFGLSVLNHFFKLF